MTSHPRSISDVVLLCAVPLDVHVLLCGHQWFLHGFTALSVSLFVYKNVLGVLSREEVAGNVILLALYAALENTRLYQSSKGNKTKQRAPLVFATALAAPALICHSYFLQLQTHVLQLDRVMNSIAIALVHIEVFLNILTLLWLFQKSTISL
ncbi:putative membrane protein [Phytophthora infestans]|uniref:Putative membrane protein n=1 Tax=Phytophthora infestans TaxID=4787 RepID=A0A833T7R1_PHYIN|nr:putative membrane protein [Phytophthora infestans]KAF4149669.1 putative membrane protein [Phytophthora infestans]